MPEKVEAFAQSVGGFQKYSTCVASSISNPHFTCTSSNRSFSNIQFKFVCANPVENIERTVPLVIECLGSKLVELIEVQPFRSNPRFCAHIKTLTLPSKGGIYFQVGRYRIKFRNRLR